MKVKEIKVKIEETLNVSFDSTRYTSSEIREIVKEEFSNITNDLLLRIGERLDEE